MPPTPSREVLPRTNPEGKQMNTRRNKGQTQIGHESSESSPSACTRKLDHAAVVSAESEQAFGGPVGALSIMLFSHVLLFYMWYSVRHKGGVVLVPRSASEAQQLLQHAAASAAPTTWAATVYLSFVLLQWVLAVYCPGRIVRGLPLKLSSTGAFEAAEAERLSTADTGSVQLEYRCNGVWAWWVTLAIVAVLDWSGILPLELLYERSGSLMTCAVLFADAAAVAAYVAALTTGNAVRMSGSHIYDFFMGAYLNPRVGTLDIKMWSEIRTSWILLFLLTLSSAVHQVRKHGELSPALALMVLAHWLYANACQKGEECIPTTWDIFYEKWGWMLSFWNLAGVPFLYCFQSFFLAYRSPSELAQLWPVAHTPSMVALFVVLLAAYYVWDTANSQKNRYRMMQMGTYNPRAAFPQLPWGTLYNPKTLEMPSTGRRLLIDGWWGMARKINYTPDLVMALVWSLSCGTQHVLPFFYPVFFCAILTHRAGRDATQMRKKYGDEDYERYLRTVPAVFIPGVL